MQNIKDIKTTLQFALTDLLEEGFSKAEILSYIQDIQANQDLIQQWSNGNTCVPVTGSSLINIKEKIIFDQEKNQLVFEDGFIKLTPNESKLLLTFLMFQGEVLTNNDLMRAVYNNSTQECICPANTRVWLYRLRKKLAEIPNTENWLKNVRGIGYYFSLE